MTDHLDDATLAMFREGLLPQDEAAGVRSHLSGCAGCRRSEAQLSLVTELLAAAPVPPMPAALATRIEAAIAAEAATRAAGGPAAQPGAAGPGAGSGPRRAAAASGPVAGRPPRAPGRVLSRARLRLMAAAAAIVVVGGGGYAVAQLAAQPGGTAAAGSVAAGAHAASPAGRAALEAPNNPAGGQTAVTQVASGTDYTRGGFGGQVRAVLTRYPAGGARRHGAGGRALPGGGLPGCLRAVTGGQLVRLVDVAHYRGQPALIIVAEAGAGGVLHAWAVGRDCSAGRPDVLAQVTVPAAG